MRRFSMRANAALGKVYVESFDDPDGAWCLWHEAASAKSEMAELFSRFIQISHRLDEYYLGGSPCSESLQDIRNAANEIGNAASRFFAPQPFPVSETDMGAAYMAGYAAAKRDMESMGGGARSEGGAA